MTKLNFSENELADRWGVSPKTLQRWRTEGRGPKYLKLSKRVIYPLEEIQTFESNALYASTSERAQASKVMGSPDSSLMTVKEIAIATGLPIYIFSNKTVREAAGIPYLHINATLRFNVRYVMNWTLRRPAELTGICIEPPVDANAQEQTLRQSPARLPT